MKQTLLAVIVLSSGLLAWKKEIILQLPEKYNKPATLIQAASLPPAKDNTRIKVAFLLDTSNSMDGLIDQAKSRLWNIVNTLTTLKYQSKTPVIEIALYEYGNDALSAETGFIRQVVPLTTDLDLISEKLFSLHTYGGEEYCGAVIRSAVKSLDWGNNEADMKLIYIAGNEPFNQGRINYVTATEEALSKNIFINTIFCGSKQEGIATKWKDGADKGKGKYFNIDSDRKVVFVETPYDSLITVSNERFNHTYIAYGAYGASKKSNQVLQDANAKSISNANSVERYISKSKVVYKNESWDLVDLYKKDTTVLKTIKKTDLPIELQNKTEKEIKEVVVAKVHERDNLQKEIDALGKKRQKYIEETKTKSTSPDDLGTAITKSIVELAATKGYIKEK